jgi:FKBP-type peptidyl-prolyl cis-trans isomerase
MKLKAHTTLFLLLIILSFVSCKSSQKFKTVEGDSFQYRYVEKGKGIQVDSGKVAEILISQYLETTDSVYQEMQFPGKQGALIENISENPMIRAFMIGKVGDSLTIKIPNTGQLREMTPPDFPDTGWLRMEIRFLNVEEQASYEARKTKELQAKIEIQKEIDENAIQAYLKSNNIKNAQRTASGLYYIITEEGNGNTAQKEQEVEVHYTSTFLDGTKFDSSLDRNETFQFPLGINRVILGWDEGISFFSEGTKGTLLIPSHLAYGAKGSGAIPPFTPTKYDIEIIKIHPIDEK